MLATILSRWEWLGWHYVLQPEYQQQHTEHMHARVGLSLLTS